MAEDLQTGFGGIHWSTSLEQIGNCENIDRQGDIQYCIRSDQPHTLLGEPVPQVLYGFYQNAFFAVFIRIENDDAYAQTKRRMLDLLGTPETSLDKEGVVSMLRWTAGQTQIELSNDRSKQGFRLVCKYLPIAKKALSRHKTLAPSKWPAIKWKHSDETEPIGILQF
jgi:hypothetical protein